MAGEGKGGDWRPGREKDKQGETDTKQKNMPKREKAENKWGLKANPERERENQK